MSSLSGVMETRRFVERRQIGAVGSPHERLARVGDPVIRIAAAVGALVDVQALLPAAALRGDFDALDLVGQAIGKIDVDQNVVRHALGQHAADDVGCEFQAGLPVRRLAVARS